MSPEQFADRIIDVLAAPNPHAHQAGRAKQANKRLRVALAKRTQPPAVKLVTSADEELKTAAAEAVARLRAGKPVFEQS